MVTTAFNPKTKSYVRIHGNNRERDSRILSTLFIDRKSVETIGRLRPADPSIERSIHLREQVTRFRAGSIKTRFNGEIYLCRVCVGDSTVHWRGACTCWNVCGMPEAMQPLAHSPPHGWTPSIIRWGGVIKAVRAGRWRIDRQPIQRIVSR